MQLSRGPGRDKAVVNLRRLALLRPSGSGLKSVWQSEPFNSTSVSASDIAGTCWTSGDINADGRRELLLFGLALLVFLAFLYYITRYHGAPAG